MQNGHSLNYETEATSLTANVKENWMSFVNVAWKIGIVAVAIIAFFVGKIQQDNRQDNDIVNLGRAIEKQSENIKDLAATVKSDHEFILKVEGAREARDAKRERTRSLEDSK